MTIQDTHRFLHCGCYRLVRLGVSPTSYRAPRTGVAEAIRHFTKIRGSVPDISSVYDEVREYFHSIFKISNPYHFNDKISDLKKSTSPGLYYKSLGYKTKTDVLEDKKALNRLRFYCHLIKTGKLRNARPITEMVAADAKYDVEKGRTKSRIIFVYPIEVCAIEQMFYAPFNDQLPNDWVPKPETHHHKFCGFNSISFDFSNFDRSVHRTLIYTAFSILRSLLDFSRYQGGAIPYKASNLSRLWGFIVNYFVNTAFTDGMTLFTKRHGVPSGSLFTNLIDTIISRLIITFLHRVSGCTSRVCTYGDDCHSIGCTCSKDHLIRGALAFGMTLKIEVPNEHGCLTYCKAECHNGVPFHNGLWYRNILNCCPPSIRGIVAYCMLYSEPTRDQAYDLLSMARLEYDSIHPRLKNKIERMLEYQLNDEVRVSHL